MSKILFNKFQSFKKKHTLYITLASKMFKIKNTLILVTAKHKNQSNLKTKENLFSNLNDLKLILTAIPLRCCMIQVQFSLSEYCSPVMGGVITPFDDVSVPPHTVKKLLLRYKEIHGLYYPYYTNTNL